MLDGHLMGSACLPDFIENAEYELEILIPAGLRRELDFKGVHKLCDRFRQRGVCSFLLTGDAHPFYTNVILHVSESLRDSPKVAFDPDAWRRLRL